MAELVSRKTKKRIEGIADLGKMIAERNPVAHSIITAKETADSAHKIIYGKDPKYLQRYTKRTQAVPKRFRVVAKKTPYVARKTALERLLEEDPLKRMYRQTRDPELKRELRRLMA